MSNELWLAFYWLVAAVVGFAVAFSAMLVFLNWYDNNERKGKR